MINPNALGEAIRDGFIELGYETKLFGVPYTDGFYDLRLTIYNNVVQLMIEQNMTVTFWNGIYDLDCLQTDLIEPDFFHRTIKMLKKEINTQRKKAYDRKKAHD